GPGSPAGPARGCRQTTASRGRELPTDRDRGTQKRTRGRASRGGSRGRAWRRRRRTLLALALPVALLLAALRATSVLARPAFDGPTATDAIPVAGPPGKYQIDAFAKWRTNGFEGHFDIPQKLRCSPAPGLAVEKLQQIAGVTGTWTPAPLNGEVGQTVDYAIVVHNTGNVPLTLSGFSDPRCDPGSIAGGPPLGLPAPGV